MSKIAIYNKDGIGIGSEERSVVYQKGLWHGLVRVLLYNSKGQLVCQYRSSNEDTFPNTWDQSAGGHVDAGEDHLTAAKRELEEELGVKGVELELITSYTTDSSYNDKIIRRFNSVFKTVYDGEFTLQLEEVEKVKWFSQEEIRFEIKENPDHFTPGLRDLIEKYAMS